MARIALHGREFLKNSKYTGHFVAEGRDQSDLQKKLNLIRNFVGTRGLEIPNSMPTVVRANPFSPLPVTHPDGRRFLPLHGILPHSAVTTFHLRYTELIDSFQKQLDKHRVTIAGSFTAVGRNGFLYEPVFYWEDSLDLFHERRTPAEIKGGLKAFPSNKEGRKVVAEVKTAIVDLMFEHGATHLQIGKTYPYLTEREPAFLDLLTSLKAKVDPSNLMNPGALGLGGGSNLKSARTNGNGNRD